MTLAITTKLLGYLSGGLGAAALLASGTAALQTHRLHETQGTVTSLRGDLDRAAKAFDTVVVTANERAQALAGRDEIIAAQSGSIDALALKASEGRTVYVAGIAKADQSAKANEARAAEIVALPAPAADKRCQAARDLIEKELLNVR